MATLAIMACVEASAGRLEPQDATKIMDTFNAARRKARGDAVMATKIGLQQVSKFRQFLRLGAEHGEAGVAMLDAVVVKRRRLLRKGETLRHNGEYNAMIAAAREALRAGKVVRNGALVKFLTK
jgi:hypothetical protein